MPIFCEPLRKMCWLDHVTLIHIQKGNWDSPKTSRCDSDVLYHVLTQSCPWLFSWAVSSSVPRWVLVMCFWKAYLQNFLLSRWYPFYRICCWALLTLSRGSRSWQSRYNWHLLVVIVRHMSLHMWEQGCLRTFAILVLRRRQCSTWMFVRLWV